MKLIVVFPDSLKLFDIGVIHKGCPHKFGNFWNPPLSVQACPHLVDWLTPPRPPLPLSVRTQDWYYLKHCNL